MLEKEMPTFAMNRVYYSMFYAIQGPESDVDLLVELTEPRFDFLAGLQMYLESKIGKPVELIRKRPGLSERFLKRIETQIQYA